AAFSAFGNGGLYSEPFTVTRVEYPDGKIVDLTPQPDAVMADYTAYMVTDMLKDAITKGTGQTYANIPNLPVAGKTGTTNLPDDLGGGANNSWFVGYTTNFTVSVWVGYEKSNKALIEGQRSIAQSLFKQTMTELSKDIETPDFKKPNSVVEVAIENGTNPPKLPSKFTPSDRVITELFVEGHQPSETSDQYDQLDPVKNLKADFDHEEEKITVTWDYDEEANFEIHATIDDGGKRHLSTIDERSFEITRVDLGSTYEIEVIALDKNNRAEPSEPKTTIIKLPESEDEDNNENEEDEDLEAVSNLQAAYDDQAGVIDVSWNYNGPPAEFKVTVNGQEQVTS